MLKTEKANNETEEEEEEDKDDPGVEEECRGKQKEAIVKRNETSRNDRSRRSECEAQRKTRRGP
jgi:hypothetical protein